MDKKLTYIHPNALHDVWGLIKPGIEACRLHSTDGWIAEDVYMAIRSANSTLHIGEIDGEYIGFVVLTPQQGYDRIRLQVWLAYAKTEHDPIDLFIDDLRKMARAIKASELTFASPREWGRRLKNYGWKPTKQTYTMEV